MSDNDLSPDDLLIKRLIMLQRELDDYKLGYQILFDNLTLISQTVLNIVESLPEPIVLDEVAEYIQDPFYKKFIEDSSVLISTYKMELEAGKTLADEIMKIKPEETF